MANCPSCHRYFALKGDAIAHIQRYHVAELDAKGITAAQWLYASTHGGDYHGKCMICGKPTDWNDKTLKPRKLCDDPKCRTALKSAYDKNRDAKLHMSQSELMSNMDHQREMLSKRKIAGRYRFRDGGEVEYVAKLELSFLQFCDKIMDLKSSDILPSPDVFEYFDPKDGRNHSYVPDFFLPEYNLLVEIKDRGNTNPAFLEETRYKVALKDDAMRKQSKYHYLRISGTNYGPFMEILYKITHGEDKKDPNRKNIVMIDESVTVPVPETRVPVLKVVYVDGPDRQVQCVAIGQAIGSKLPTTWQVSDYSSEKIYEVDNQVDVLNGGNTKHYQYNGEPSKIASAYDNIRTQAMNPTADLEWSILEILKGSQIAFDDGYGLHNNDQKRMDFIPWSDSAGKEEDE